MCVCVYPYICPYMHISFGIYVHQIYKWITSLGAKSETELSDNAQSEGNLKH